MPSCPRRTMKYEAAVLGVRASLCILGCRYVSSPLAHTALSLLFSIDPASFLCDPLSCETTLSSPSSRGTPLPLRFLSSPAHETPTSAPSGTLLTMTGAGDTRLSSDLIDDILWNIENGPPNKGPRSWSPSPGPESELPWYEGHGPTFGADEIVLESSDGYRLTANLGLLQSHSYVVS